MSDEQARISPTLITARNSSVSQKSYRQRSVRLPFPDGVAPAKFPAPAKLRGGNECNRFGSRFVSHDAQSHSNTGLLKFLGIHGRRIVHFEFARKYRSQAETVAR